ncbi:trypsin-1-like [Episyrphus balteatus]|uniref:trypsin-1-like n=1 Tax=Episyrphus balteatus TaxID=286459 RepID=UPI002485F933|nr:trypsin-1-like [Episyrphus balteatus]
MAILNGDFVALAILLLINVFTSDCSKLQMRVVGGSAAPANSAPFIVSLQQVTSTKNVHYCAGTILNTNWIVTAAHCLSSSNLVYNSVVLAGSILVSGTASTAQTRSISYYVVNDLYVGGTAPYDIGLVYVATAFTWTNAVKPAALPTAGAVPTGTASLYGWGSTSTSSEAIYPTTLQVASSVTIITLATCESALGKDLSVNLHDTNICTGPLTGGISICTSDSGGPLMQGNTLIGIVSWGKLPCGQTNSPSVYVLVSDFISWIFSNQKVPSLF